MKTRWLIIAAFAVGTLAIVAAVLFVAGPRMGLTGIAQSPATLATARYLPGGDSKMALIAPAGATVDLLPEASGGVPVARLSGVKPDAPANGLPGIYLPLSEAFETAASGETVVVTVTARRAADSQGSAFALAYSTNEVGNSNWRRFDLTEQLAPYTFTYDVPRMASGKGDFIGILPDPTGAGGAVEISEIKVEVFPRGQLDKAATGATTTP